MRSNRSVRLIEIQVSKYKLKNTSQHHNITTMYVFHLLLTPFFTGAQPPPPHVNPQHKAYSFSLSIIFIFYSLNIFLRKLK